MFECLLLRFKISVFCRDYLVNIGVYCCYCCCQTHRRRQNTPLRNLHIDDVKVRPQKVWWMLYIHNWSLQPFSQHYDLASHTIYVVCINFIHYSDSERRKIWWKLWLNYFESICKSFVIEKLIHICCCHR